MYMNIYIYIFWKSNDDYKRELPNYNLSIFQLKKTTNKKMDNNVESDFCIWSINVNEFQWKLQAKQTKKRTNKILVCKHYKIQIWHKSPGLCF